MRKIFSCFMVLCLVCCCAIAEEATFELAGQDWTIEEFQTRANELFQYQRTTGDYTLEEDEYYFVSYVLEDNGAYFFHIFHQIGDETEMTEEAIVATDHQIGLATTDSASIMFEDIVVALAFNALPDNMATMIFRLQAKKNDWLLMVDDLEFRYYQDALQLLIIEH